MSSVQKFAILAAVFVGVGASNPAVAADFLVDDFQDANPIAEGFGPGAWVGSTAGDLGLGLAYRTRDVFPLGFASLEAAIVADPTNASNTVFRLGELADPMDVNQPFSAIQFSDRLTTNSLGEPQTLQFAGYNLARSSGTFDSTPYKYVRFVAWLDSPQPNWSNITDAGVVVSLTDGANNSSVGPWDATGTSLNGLQLTNTPDAYIVRINETVPTQFKVDPIFNEIFATQNVDATAVVSLQIGYRRSRVPAAQTNLLGARWFLDDVAFLEELPSIVTTGPVLATINENTGITSTTFTVELTSSPTDPVTIDFTASDPTAVSFVPSSWTFLPEGSTPGAGESLWSVQQTITVSAINDNDIEPDQVISISFPTTTSDLFYDSVSVAPLSLTILDDDTPAPTSVLDWKTLNK
ncbi:MAG: hypothetical protein ACFCU1_03300 [Sumerlaeia bacterium]